MLKGSVQGDRLTVSIGNKAKSYTIQTSAFIGPLTKKEGPDEQTAPPASEESNTKPSVKLAVEKSADSSPSGSISAQEAPTGAAKVMVSSEPSGADLYVDGNFMGNTPSQIQIAAGSHDVRVELRGHTPWSRAITLTAGSKVTIQAVLDSKQ